MALQDHCSYKAPLIFKKRIFAIVSEGRIFQLIQPFNKVMFD